MMAYARFVRENYTYIILTTLVIAVVVGLFTSSPGAFIKHFNTPLIIVLIAAMSFTITFRDMAAAAMNWQGSLFGVGVNFVLAPLLCWTLASLLLQNHAELAAGFVLIGVVPCAGMAMMWTGLLKGNVPLSIVIEALTMLLAPFVIPPLMSLLAGKFVAVNIWSMFQQLVYTVLLPVLGAIGLRELLQKRIDIQRYLPLMPAISASVAVLLMFMAINTSILPITKNLAAVGPLVAAAVLCFPILFTIAYVASFRLFPRGTSIALTYSSGMKNLPLAIGIAAMSLKGLASLPVAVAFAFQMLTAVTFYQLFRRTTP